MTFLQDLQYGWRNLAKTPGFLIVAVLSLTLGIGGNTALFSLLYSAVYKTLPIDDPQLLILFSDPSREGMSTGSETGERSLLSWPEFQDLHQMTALQGLFAVQATLPKWRIRLGPNEEEARAKMVSGAYFSVLRLRPQLGRFFDESADGQMGAARYVVLSDDYWTRRFGRDPGVLGKSIVIQKTSFGVIGVTPGGFSGENVGQNPDFWIPASMQMQVMPGGDFLHPQPDPADKVMWLHVFGRLKPQTNLATAQTQANAIFKASLEQSYQSLSQQARKGLLDQHLTLRSASTGASGLRTKFAESLYVIFAAVGAVLLICCANLSNLIFARANARQREITVRLALGASKFRVARQLFTFFSPHPSRS
jgi:predicted permease